MYCDNAMVNLHKIIKPFTIESKNKPKLERIIKIERDYLISENGKVEKRHITINSPDDIALNNVLKQLLESTCCGEYFVAGKEMAITFSQSNLCEVQPCQGE